VGTNGDLPESGMLFDYAACAELLALEEEGQRGMGTTRTRQIKETGLFRDRDW
jgi:hypothetical protein